MKSITEGGLRPRVGLRQEEHPQRGAPHRPQRLQDRVNVICLQNRRTFYNPKFGHHFELFLSVLTVQSTQFLLCRVARPTNAIMGTSHRLHTVFDSAMLWQQKGQFALESTIPNSRKIPTYLHQHFLLQGPPKLGSLV
jgi:hypothetical protein